MESRDGDTFVIKDDHNHNYRSTRSSKVLLDSKAVPEAVCGPVQMGEEADAQRVWTVDLGGSDSGSESSEVSEADCTAMSDSAEGKFTLDSTPKLRKLHIDNGPRYIDVKQRDDLSSFPCVKVGVWLIGVFTIMAVSEVIYLNPDESACFPPHSDLNALALEDYRKNHWPNLEKAIDRLLLHNPTDHISVSYAQIYR